MIYLVAFVVLVLATARLTRLASKDDLTVPARLWIDKRFGRDSWISRMVWCFWCSGVWVSLFTCAIANNLLMHLIGWDLLTSILTYILLVPATAYAASRVIDMEKSD